jgi:hypothetical protein
MKVYKHEVEEPKFEKIGSGKGHMVAMKSCDDFKSDASDQAFGQAGYAGCMSDQKKIHAQFNHSYTDDAGF